MTNKERLKLAKRLIDEEIDRTLDMWCTAQDRYTYTWGWREPYTVGNNHGPTFFYAEEVISIVKALRLNYTLTICNNEDGDPTPALRIW